MPKKALHDCAVRNLPKEERGAVLLEFSISILLVLTILFSTCELCTLIYTYAVMSDAANEGVRYAVVHSSDSAGAITRVKMYAALSLHNVANIAVSVTYPDGTAVPPSRIAVSVTYHYVPYLNFMSNPPTISAYAQGRLMY
ncbi:MAG TPA: TadE family protein [Terriglobales bacterium]|jgi:Flp pilus assembly protein TadG